MDYVKNMLASHPEPAEMSAEALSACIEACFNCEMTCTACADACLSEDMVQDLIHCIRTDLDCADVCAATGRILSRQSQPDPALIQMQLRALLSATRACAEECERHASMHEHCRVCAQSCRRCEEACNRLLDQMPVAAA